MQNCICFSFLQFPVIWNLSVYGSQSHQVKFNGPRHQVCYVFVHFSCIVSLHYIEDYLLMKIHSKVSKKMNPKTTDKKRDKHRCFDLILILRYIQLALLLEWHPSSQILTCINIIQKSSLSFSVHLIALIVSEVPSSSQSALR